MKAGGLRIRLKAGVPPARRADRAKPSALCRKSIVSCAMRIEQSLLLRPKRMIEFSSQWFAAAEVADQLRKQFRIAVQCAVVKLHEPGIAVGEATVVAKRRKHVVGTAEAGNAAEEGARKRRTVQHPQDAKLPGIRQVTLPGKTRK